MSSIEEHDPEEGERRVIPLGPGPGNPQPYTFPEFVAKWAESLPDTSALTPAHCTKVWHRFPVERHLRAVED